MRSIICVFVNENNKFLHTVFKKSVIKTSDRVRIVLGTRDISTLFKVMMTSLNPN